MSDETTPVLVGGGQFTWRGDPGSSPSPTALLKIAAERAAQDAGLGSEALAGVDGLAVISFAVDAPGERRVMPHSANPLLTPALIHNRRRRRIAGDMTCVAAQA